MSHKKKEDKDDLYALKRKILKEKRILQNKIIGNDTVDGSTFQRFYGESTKTRRALKIELFGSKSKASKYNDDTSIEKFVEDILVEAGVKFVKQKAIRYINVDFFLPDANIALQINGCYWHACSKCYPNGPKNEIQRKNIEKDKVATEIILGKNHILVDIWAHEIEEDPETVKSRILELIEKK